MSSASSSSSRPRRCAGTGTSWRASRSATARVRPSATRIVEDVRPGRLDAELAERLGVSPGPDFGRLKRGEVVDGVRPEQVLGAERAGRKIVISGDTMPSEALAVAADQAEVLVHEATFAEEESERASQTGHSTARQAAERAREARVRMLALTHVSSRYLGRELLAEAQAVFPGAFLARDFDTIEVPFPEHGEPRLVHWPNRQTPEPSPEPIPAS